MDKLIGIRVKLAEMSAGEFALFQEKLADAYSDNWRKAFVDAMFQLLLCEYRNHRVTHRDIIANTIASMIQNQNSQPPSIPFGSPSAVSGSESESTNFNPLPSPDMMTVVAGFLRLKDIVSLRRVSRAISVATPMVAPLLSVSVSQHQHWLSKFRRTHHESQLKQLRLAKRVSVQRFQRSELWRWSHVEHLSFESIEFEALAQFQSLPRLKRLDLRGGAMSLSIAAVNPRVECLMLCGAGLRLGSCNARFVDADVADKWANIKGLRLQNGEFHGVSLFNDLLRVKCASLESLHIDHHTAAAVSPPLNFAQLKELCMHGQLHRNVLHILDRAPRLQRVHCRFADGIYSVHSRIIKSIMTKPLKSLSLKLDLFSMSMFEWVLEQIVDAAPSECALRTLRFEMSTNHSIRRGLPAVLSRINELIKKLREFKLTVAIEHVSDVNRTEIAAIPSALDGLDDSFYSWSVCSSENRWIARIENKDSKVCGFSARWMY